MRVPSSCSALILAAAVGLPTGQPSTLAGTIRDDRADADYTRLSTNPAWGAVGAMRVLGQPSCTASLIAPQWVLCAAHCVLPSRGFLLPGQTFVIAGRSYEVDSEDIFIHPAWVSTGFDVIGGNGDIALFRLSRPVNDVRPLVPYRARDEVGNVGFSIGYGRTGTGRNGQTVGTAERRAGQNMIDATAARVVWPGADAVAVGNDRMLLYDFDSPQLNFSSLGAPNPLNLEYTTAQGDSGGPLFVFRGGRFMIAGICSGGIGPVGRNVSTYGDTATFARVSSYTAWIKRVMNNQEPSLAVMIRSGQLRAADIERARRRAAERSAAMERRGVRLTAFAVDPGLQREDADSFAARIGLRSSALPELVAAVSDHLQSMADDTTEAALPHVECGSCGVPTPLAPGNGNRDRTTPTASVLVHD